MEESGGRGGEEERLIGRTTEEGVTGHSTEADHSHPRLGRSADERAHGQAEPGQKWRATREGRWRARSERRRVGATQKGAFRVEARKL